MTNKTINITPTICEGLNKVAYGVIYCGLGIFYGIVGVALVTSGMASFYQSGKEYINYGTPFNKDDILFATGFNACGIRFLIDAYSLCKEGWYNLKEGVLGIQESISYNNQQVQVLDNHENLASIETDYVSA